MTARRKNSSRANRITAYRPWDPDFAEFFLVPDGWTPPDRVKIVHGKAGGTFTAVFKDHNGGATEAYTRVRYTKTGSIMITEQGLRASFKWSLSGGAK